MKKKNNKSKLLLIGWDAADWKIINPLLEQGLLPNLERMINEGVMGNLATLEPAYSPMLWTSIATGKRPYQHGVLGFTEVTPDGKSVQPVLSSSRKVRAIWDILSEKGYKTHVVGWWPSHPAEAMNGVSISNFYQKDVGAIDEPWPMPEGSVYPPSMKEHFASLRVHFQELTGQHLLPFIPEAEKIDQTKDKRIASVAKVTAHAATIQAAFTNILRTQEWDFAAVYFDAIDHYGHGFMRYHPPHRPHIPKPDFDLYNNVITAGYRYHDLLLGRLLDLAGEDTTVMLVSDHGFEPDDMRPDYIPKEFAGRAYEHGPYGIFCMKGPGIRKDDIIYGANLLDVTPTILQLFDLPVGEDMDGKVLGNAFDTVPKVNTIPTWETKELAKKSESIQLNEEDQQDMIDRLVELGYIDAPSKDMDKWVEKEHKETAFNLARAYIDGGKWLEAIPLLEDLVTQEPTSLRFAIRLATCYQTIGQFAECRALISPIREQELFRTPVFDVIESALLVGESKFREALVLLQEVEDKFKTPHARIHLQIARCYYHMNMYDKALERTERAIQQDYNNVSGHYLNGVINYHLDRFEPAIESLLTAAGLDYHNAVSHFYLGMALFKQGKYKAAVNAFEVCLLIDPKINKAREHLVAIYQTHLNEPQKAATHRQNYQENFLGEITIVSGLPRSGTSMMMQMLQSAGLDMFTDEEREKDESNPKGYLEHRAVMGLRENKTWLPMANGKTMKVIANLLPFLPARYKYRIIFMERDLEEILQSQYKMLKRMGKNVHDDVYPTNLAQKFEVAVKNAKLWASKQPNVDIIYVSYSNVIAEPFKEAVRISTFLEQEVLPEQLIQAVDANLYREHKKKTLSHL